jgi:hypothetical protein
MTDKSKPIAFSHLPMLDYEAAEKWLAGKAGALQDEADVALENLPNGFITEDGPDIYFCAGDLVVDDLPLSCDCLIVAGNLKVKDLISACDSALIVLGDAEVGRYISQGAYTVICGNLRAGHVCTNSLNDLYFYVGGDVEAESFAEFGEYVKIHGNLKVGKLINWMNEIEVLGERKAEVVIDSDIPIANLTALLRAELIHERWKIDDDAYKACLERNVSPFL